MSSDASPPYSASKRCRTDASPSPSPPLLSAPLAVTRARQLVAAADGPAHNRLLAQTAQLMLVYSALLAIGIALLRR